MPRPLDQMVGEIALPRRKSADRLEHSVVPLKYESRSSGQSLKILGHLRPGNLVYGAQHPDALREGDEGDESRVLRGERVKECPRSPELNRVIFHKKPHYDICV